MVIVIATSDVECNESGGCRPQAREEDRGAAAVAILEDLGAGEVNDALRVHTPTSLSLRRHRRHPRSLAAAVTDALCVVLAETRLFPLSRMYLDKMNEVNNKIIEVNSHSFDRIEILSIF